MSAYDTKNLARMERTLLERSSAAWEAARPRKTSNPLCQNISGTFRDDDPGGGAAQVQDLREGGVPSFHAAAPPDDASGVNVAQCGPEVKDQACFFATPVKHPNPGALSMGQTRSVDIPVDVVLNNEGLRQRLR